VLRALLSKSALWRMCAAVAAGVLTPPTIACFVGMLVASIKPLQVRTLCWLATPVYGWLSCGT